MNLNESFGRILFALAVIGSGVQQLATQNFVRLVPKLPEGSPALPWLAVLSGALLVLAGLALVLNRWLRPAAITVAVFLVATLGLHEPAVAAHPEAGYVWTNPGKLLVLLGGCLLLARKHGGVHSHGAIRVAAIVLGAFLVLAGIQHGVYVDFVAQLVPAWLPAPRAWAWGTGAALLAGGIGVMWPRTARAAAIASGAMIFAWVLVLHLPRAWANRQDAGETSGVFEAMALSAVAWLVAAAVTRPPRPTKAA